MLHYNFYITHTLRYNIEFFQKKKEIYLYLFILQTIFHLFQVLAKRSNDLHAHQNYGRVHYIIKSEFIN